MFISSLLSSIHPRFVLLHMQGHHNIRLLEESGLKPGFEFLKDDRGFGNGKKVKIGDGDDVKEGYEYCSVFGLGRKSLSG
ncbi:hypothetical protein QVD17_12195 [Tagetes erecta]|uniref:Uncharacterized protein n=1 Tax=Tagetes erecta TaxID=13708 RepID=A0AAD8KVN7_TARER|nr:hypothetical protein QVD17_12195 [Tagetes erecta]